MATYKLHYFNVRGRGEVIRLIFAAAGQPFEDVRYEQNQWPSAKSEMPLGQIPVLEVDGVKLPQSLSIARFVAKQFQLAGQNNLEQAKVDAVCDTNADLFAKFSSVVYENDIMKKIVGIEKFLTDELPKHLKNLDILAKLYSDGGPFFVGNHLTWCDLFVYDILQNVITLDGNLLNSYPWLQRNRQEVEKQPNIAAYLKSRPKTLF